MKKLIFIGILGLFALGSCNSKGHEGHDHETTTHKHETEGHDHEAEAHVMKVNVVKTIITTKPLTSTNTVKLPKDMVTKSFFQKQKQTLPGQINYYPTGSLPTSYQNQRTSISCPRRRICCCSYCCRRSFIPWKSNGRHGCWSGKTIDYHLFQQYSRW